MNKPITVALASIGLGLLVFSSLWPHLSSGEAYWGDEQQAQFSEARRNTHELEARQNTGKRQTAANKTAQEQELAAAQAHWKGQLARLAEAKTASQRPARICFWAGLVVALAGVLAYRFLP
jgi:hypothetical protein